MYCRTKQVGFLKAGVFHSLGNLRQPLRSYRSANLCISVCFRHWFYPAVPWCFFLQIYLILKLLHLLQSENVIMLCYLSSENNQNSVVCTTLRTVENSFLFDLLSFLKRVSMTKSVMCWLLTLNNTKVHVALHSEYDYLLVHSLVVALIYVLINI